MLERLKAKYLDISTLRGRVVNVTFWSSLAAGIGQPLRLVSNLIMTRLLVPEAFGLMAVVTIVHMALNLMSDVGLRQSVIRDERGEDAHYLRVVWTVKIIRSLTLSAILLAVAAGFWLLGPILAVPGTVYADPVLPALLAASVALVLIEGVQPTTRILLGRRMHLRLLVMLDLSSQVFGLVVTATAAYLTGSVWALLFGSISANLLLLALSHRLLPGPRMALAWDREQTAELWRFGRWIIPSTLGEFLTTNADRLLFAAILDAKLFGLYAVAFVWVRAGTMLLGRLGNPVFMPLFSAIKRERPGRLTWALRRAFAGFAALAVLMTAGLYLFGVYVVEYLYTGSFVLIGVLIPALSFRIGHMAFRPLLQFLLTEGDSRYVALVQVTRAIAAILGVVIGLNLLSFSYALMLMIIGPSLGTALLIAHPAIRTRLSMVWPSLFLAALAIATVAHFALVGHAEIAGLVAGVEP